MQEVEIVRRIEAPPQTVWDAYTDHASWTRWAGLGKVRLLREGEPAPNGVGCVREIRSGPISVQEEVLSFEPPKRMTYRVVRGGPPIRDHFGEVHFEEAGEGATRVVWRCRFDSRIPGLGFALRPLFAKVFRDALRGLERHLGA